MNNTSSEVNLRKQFDAGPFSIIVKGGAKGDTMGWDIVIMAMWTDSYTAEWGALANTFGSK